MQRYLNLPVLRKYYYVNNFSSLDVQWTEIGEHPYLDSTVPANRIEAVEDGLVESWFSFEDETQITDCRMDYSRQFAIFRCS